MGRDSKARNNVTNASMLLGWPCLGSLQVHEDSVWRSQGQRRDLLVVRRSGLLVIVHIHLTAEMKHTVTAFSLTYLQAHAHAPKVQPVHTSMLLRHSPMLMCKHACCMTCVFVASPCAAGCLALDRCSHFGFTAAQSWALGCCSTEMFSLAGDGWGGNLGQLQTPDPQRQVTLNQRILTSSKDLLL